MYIIPFAIFWAMTVYWIGNAPAAHLPAGGKTTEKLVSNVAPPPHI